MPDNDKVFYGVLKPSSLLDVKVAEVAFEDPDDLKNMSYEEKVKRAEDNFALLLQLGTEDDIGSYVLGDYNDVAQLAAVSFSALIQMLPEGHDELREKIRTFMDENFKKKPQGE